MDIVKSFKVFQLVAQEQSFSRAADSLNLVPSAVSRQINELEHWLGVRLLNRTTRTVHLTKEGSDYLAKTSQIIELVDALKFKKNDHKNIEGKLKISAPMMLGQHLLPQIVAGFKRDFPNVKLSLFLLNRKVDLIEEGFDLALRVSHLADSNLVARKLGNLSFATVASSDYLASNGTPQVPTDLQQHSCLINSAVSSANRWGYKINGRGKNVKVAGDIDANESLALLSLAKQGQGVAFLPEVYVQKELANGTLVEVLREFRPEPLPINLLYVSNRLVSPVLKTFIDYVVAYFPEVMPKLEAEVLYP
ncbi:transcriptional regulator, LysR family [Glaciecola sp. 4H-3-7+YE-5]|nr:transcriptional regulator, LysR family [Glaciecola sp. 4H-3-7+YE-5]